MPPPFILRFQETCDVVEGFCLSSGTETITAVHAEQIDADPDRRRYGVLAQVADAGTSTKTRILTEHSDEDRGFSPMRMFAGGTQTATFTRAENGDRDPHERQHSVFS
jgi:hypothetical protein